MSERIESWSNLFVDPREYTKTLDLPDPASIRIYDTTLRDGEQTPGVAMSPEQKYRIAEELSAIGVHIIDLGFPAVSAGERRILQLMIEGKRRGEIREALELLVMCRANKHDIDATIQAIQEIGGDVADITFLIFSSNSFLHCKYKLGPMLMKREGLDPRDLADTPLEFFHEANKRMIRDAISYARSRGVQKIESGAEDASRTPLEYVIDFGKCAIEAGATRFNFPDTTGSLTPEATRYYCRALKEAFHGVELVSHFHNDFDMATINSICGVLNGFTTFTATINGLGERAGNAPLHSVVAGLKYLYGLEIPNFKYERLWRIKRLVEEITGIPVQAQEPVIGHNVYSHESGIHTHGVNIARRMYEPIPFEEIGGEARFVYGKHSGSNILQDLLTRRAAEIGHQIDNEFVSAVLGEIKYQRGLRVTQRKTSRFVSDYYDNLNRLSMGEDAVIELAREVGVRRAQPAGTKRTPASFQSGPHLRDAIA
jgi:isopropylmalate/homocitrate/citramalate synthase